MKLSQFKDQMNETFHAQFLFAAPAEDIYTFMPFTKQRQLEPHILYIGHYADLLLQESSLAINFLCLSQVLKNIGGSLDSSLISRYPNANFIFIPWEEGQPIDLVYDTTTRIFLAENRYTNQINRLVAASNSNRGLQHLIDEAYQINKSPILVIDSSYRILAMYEDSLADEKIGLRDQRQLGCLSEQNLNRMKRDRIFESLREADTKMHYRKASDSDYYWADTLVFIHGIEVAEIGMVEYDHTFTSYDFEFIHFLAQLVAWEMQKKSFLSPHHIQMHGVFLSELLGPDILHPQAIEARSRMLGWKEAKCLYVFTVFSQDQRQNVRRKAEVFSIQLSRLLPDCYWTIKKDHIIFLIMKETNGLDEFQPGSPLAERLARNQMYGILSSCFSELPDVKKYYEQTLSVREFQAYDAERMPIRFYKDFYIYHIAKIISETYDLKDFCHPLIREIQDYDAKNHTDYVGTLAEYLMHIDNPSLSAQNLCIHKNTFFYRMNKLKELFGVDLKDGLERMKLLLTIEFLKLEP